MDKIEPLFLNCGGFFTAMLPVSPDGRQRIPDGIALFGISQVSHDTGASLASIREAYSVFLQECGDSIAGTEAARAADRLLRQRYAGLTDGQFAELKAMSKLLGLNPFANHVRARRRFDPDTNTTQVEIELTIEGLYSVAHRSGELVNVIGPTWANGATGWTPVWTGAEPPLAASFGVLRKGMSEALVRVAFRSPGGNESAEELAERAERDALGRAFADVLTSGTVESIAGAPRRVLNEPGDISREVLNFAREWAKRMGLTFKGKPLVPDAGQVVLEGKTRLDQEFELKLYHAGFPDLSRRREVLDMLRRKFPKEFAEDAFAFYDKAATELRTNPGVYAAVGIVQPAPIAISGRDFHLRLIDFGFQDPKRREEFVDSMRRRFGNEYATDLPKFYAKALAELRANPGQYRAVPPSAGPERVVIEGKDRRDREFSLDLFHMGLKTENQRLAFVEAMQEKFPQEFAGDAFAFYTKALEELRANPAVYVIPPAGPEKTPAPDGP